MLIVRGQLVRASGAGLSTPHKEWISACLSGLTLRYAIVLVGIPHDRFAAVAAPNPLPHVKFVPTTRRTLRASGHLATPLWAFVPRSLAKQCSASRRRRSICEMSPKPSLASLSWPDRRTLRRHGRTRPPPL